MIAVHDLTKEYHVGDHVVHALKGVSMSVAGAEFVTVVGPSGSGKSTFMHILGCLDRQTAGRYLLNSRDVSTLHGDELARVRNETIGFVFQGFNLLARTSALENVELPLLYTRQGVVKASERRDRAMAALEAVGLTDRAEHHPNQLSGGQQQRVAIARAVIGRPKLLLADEPTGNVDDRMALRLMHLFEELNRLRTTVVIATHNLQLVERLGHGRLHLDGGQLFVGVPETAPPRRVAAGESARPAMAKGGGDSPSAAREWILKGAS